LAKVGILWQTKEKKDTTKRKFLTFVPDLYAQKIGANNQKTLFQPIKGIARYGGAKETMHYTNARRECASHT